MPQFEVVPRQEAMMASSTGRAEILQEYVKHIERLAFDQAVRVTPSDGETVATVRRRLGAAVKASGRNIQIKRVGAETYLWEERPRSRVGRPPKSTSR